jgi:hypothetical protein
MLIFKHKLFPGYPGLGLEDRASLGNTQKRSGAQLTFLTLEILVLVFIVFTAVFRIRDNLVRIRILGSVPLTNGSGSGSGSCSFRQKVTFKIPTKNNFFSQSFSAFSFLRVYLHRHAVHSSTPRIRNFRIRASGKRPPYLNSEAEFNKP